MDNKLITRAIAAVVAAGMGGGAAAAQSPTTATIIVYRPWKYLAWAANYRLLLADREVCRLSNRRTLQLTVPAGPVALRSYFQDWLIKYPERQLAFNAEPGQTYYVQAKVRLRWWGAALNLISVDAATGQKAVQAIPKADKCSESVAALQP